MKSLLSLTLILFCNSAVILAQEFPRELVDFTPHPNNPVFVAAEPAAWDARIRERGWILREGDDWKMWYTGYDGDKSSVKLLGLATSRDGIHWTRHPANPLLRDEWIEDMIVVRQGCLYYMFAEGKNDQAHWFISVDGIDWHRMGQLDVRQADGSPIEAGPYGTPTVWYEDGIWYLFYERRDAGIWLATSRNMKLWTNVSDEPVLSPGPDLFDRDLVAMNQIVKHNGRYYAYYHGASDEHSPKLWATGIAVSDDLRHWTKYSGNPLQPIEQNKSSGIVVPDGAGFRFYTMHDRVDLHLPAKSER